MRLTLEALTVLDAIDRRGSFAAAAEELHRVPSAITYTVQKLEQDLDVLLFDRRGHRSVLTAAGRLLLDDGRHLLHAAARLEHSVKRVATGWEAELKIAVGDLVPLARVLPVVGEFLASEGNATHVRLSSEVLSGSWDALVSGRADLVVGAPEEGPAGGGFTVRRLGQLPFVFVVARDHPLADAAEPLTEREIARHRAVAAADSSRLLPPTTSALLSGQEVVTVASAAAKREAHLLGLGVGFIHRYLVEEDLAAGRLIAKATESESPAPNCSLAWRSDHKGKALRWFVNRLADPELWEGLLIEREI